MTEGRTAAWSALLRVHAALTPVFDQALQAAHGLPLTWYDVLLELNAAPGRQLTMGQLGLVAVVSRSRSSRVVDDLVRAGLVERVPNPADGRSAYAKITTAGRAALRAAAPTYLDAIERHFTGLLSQREASTIATALERVLATRSAKDEPALSLSPAPGRRTRPVRPHPAGPGERTR